MEVKSLSVCLITDFKSVKTRFKGRLFYDRYINPYSVGLENLPFVSN